MGNVVNTGWQSRQDASLHGKLKDLVALLEHFVLQRPVIDRQLSVLEDEFLHDVAVVGVERKDLCEADENFVLHAVLRVDERRQFL